MPYQIAQSGQGFIQALSHLSSVFISLNQQKQVQEQNALRMAEQKKQFDENLKIREENLRLTEEGLKIKADAEKRLEAFGKAKLAAQERGLDIRESIGLANAENTAQKLTLQEALGNRRLTYLENKSGTSTNTTQGKMADIKLRKMQFQMIEEDAATRPDAPDGFQSYSDTGKLLQYRRERQAALDRFTSSYVDPTNPQYGAVQNELKSIDAELLERAKFKRDHLGAAGVMASLSETHNNLPDLVSDENGPPAPTPDVHAPQPVSGLDFSDEAVFNRAAFSAVGEDSTFDSMTALNAIKTEHARLKSVDPTGGQAKSFRIRINNAYAQKFGADKARKHAATLNLR